MHSGSRAHLGAYATGDADAGEDDEYDHRDDKAAKTRSPQPVGLTRRLKEAHGVHGVLCLSVHGWE